MEIKIDLKLTESAIKELKRTKEESDIEDDSMVRVQVSAGGCSGFQYGLSFVEGNSVREEDITEDFDGLNVVVDKKSLLFLDGTTIDWIDDDLNQRGFKFDNPAAKSSCGCGSSFSC